ncbi:hypothetical protein CRG98_050083 [Punica granatum]|nr:hypothetical protein CRG98_050083 [Punica granatum]
MTNSLKCNKLRDSGLELLLHPPRNKVYMKKEGASSRVPVTRIGRRRSGTLTRQRSGRGTTKSRKPHENCRAGRGREGSRNLALRPLPLVAVALLFRETREREAGSSSGVW